MVRFQQLIAETSEETELWPKKVAAFGNLYAFLSQIMPYQDSDLERIYIFLRHLLAKLPRRAVDTQYDLSSDVRLEYYRLQKTAKARSI